MEYLSSIEIAKKWGVSPRRVVRLAQDGRIPGARLVGKNWMFPEATEKPPDARTKAGKRNENGGGSFYFPLLADYEKHHASPPLSEGETALREAQAAFYIGNFEESEKAFNRIEKSSDNIYIRLSAMYYQCLLSVFIHGGSNYDILRHKFNMTMAKDFPYKKELELTSFWLDTNIGLHKNLYEEFAVDETYDYHPSVYYIGIVLSAWASTKGDLSLVGKMKFDTYEMLAKKMEHDGFYYEAQQMDMFVFGIYFLLGNEEKMFYYLKQALKIAEEKKLYSIIATYETVYPSEFKKALTDFSDAFSRKLLSIGNRFHNSYEAYLTRHKDFNLYSLLSKADYRYVLYATQGYSAKEVASVTKHSVGYVFNKYSDIYAKLGVKSKKEIVDLLRNYLADPTG